MACDPREPPPHFYVRATAPDGCEPSPRLARLGDGCAREGCGKPPAHPVHLRPPGHGVERQAANG